MTLALRATQDSSRASTALPLLAADLIPALSPRPTSSRPRLSDDGYFDSVASLGLCRGLDMILVRRNGQLISYRALAAADIQTHEAWALAAHNVMEAALTRRGYHFRTKSAIGGVRVRTKGSPATSWLAHPAPFSVLHHHLVEVLRTPTVAYLAPAHDHLYAIPLRKNTDARRAFQAARADAGVHIPRTAVEPLLWSDGFPRPL